MSAVAVIAFLGMLSIVSAIVGGIVAAIKNRDHSWWAAWCFMFPPMLIILLSLSTNKGVRPRRPTLDDEDREQSIL